MACLKRTFLAILISSALLGCKKEEPGMVVGKIHKASKLATTEFTIDKIVHGTKNKRWIFKFNESSFIAYSKAIVKTGVDLEKLTKNDIEIDESSISLKLPPVEVITFSYPPHHFKKSDISDNSWGNKISVIEQEEFFRSAELAIRENLQYMGVVETTQRKTRTMLRTLLSSLGYNEIYIEFESDELIMDQVPEELTSKNDSKK